MHGASQYHVYSLPVELLDTLTPRNLISEVKSRPPSPPLSLPAPSALGSRTCNICLGAIFIDVDEQRAHFRTDWHRYNVKAKLIGGSAATEPEFAQLLDGLEDSISGSASSSDESGSGSSDAVNNLTRKARKLARSPSPNSGPRNLPQTALAWFHSPPDTQIGVYRALFPSGSDAATYLSELKNMQTRIENGRTWAMFMVAGGHFAGAIVRVSRPEDEEEQDPESNKRKKPKKPKPETEVLEHKTFHRYTTRRKQGGSQSMNDNAKGNAKSAGAQLRRYGEQALRDDIRNLLHLWAEEINDCERIWIRASGSNRKIFLDYEDSVIAKGDHRLRTFPFPTRRPTQAELSRCLLELTKVKMSHLTEDALRAQDEAYLATLPKPKPNPTVIPIPEPEKPKLPKLSQEEEIFREKWARLLEMLGKGRVEALKAFWDREGASLGGVDVPIPDWADGKRISLLQVAAHTGHEDVVEWLLEDAHADPTIELPITMFENLEREDDIHSSEPSDAPPVHVARGTRRTAYDLARSRAVRDVFRRCAASHPDWWDWFGTGHVPSALSKEMEAERDEKKKVRRKGLKDKVRERGARDKAKEPEVNQQLELATFSEQQTDPSAPRKLGGSSGASDGIVGLTPEMRAKVERERRARAAEARLKAR